MSDDAPRSTQGHRPDQRRGRGAPAWWDMLDRSDLPDDRTALDSYVDSPGWQSRSEPFHLAGQRSRLGVVLSVACALAIALVLVIGVWLATSITQHSAGTTAAVIAGIPAALLAASLLVVLLGRRRR